MNDPATVDPCETSTPNRLSPPQVRSPKLLQGVGFAFFRRRAMRNWINRHGHIYEINVPILWSIRRRFRPGSGEVGVYREHRTADQRAAESRQFVRARVVIRARRQSASRSAPAARAGISRSEPQELRAVIEDETLRESANWPENKEFRILEPMNRITLKVILRTILGAEGEQRDEVEQLSEIVPPWMTLGSLLAFVPAPPFRTGRRSPWGKLDEFRRSFDRIVLTLIDRAEADPGLADRVDVLALLVRSRRDDGTGCRGRTSATNC